VENLGRRALDEDLTPDQMMPPPAPTGSWRLSSAPESRWWSAGGPRVAAGHFALPGLPDAARFAAMLGHRVPEEAPEEAPGEAPVEAPGEAPVEVPGDVPMEER